MICSCNQKVCAGSQSASEEPLGAISGTAAELLEDCLVHFYATDRIQAFGIRCLSAALSIIDGRDCNLPRASRCRLFVSILHVPSASHCDCLFYGSDIATNLVCRLFAGTYNELK